MTLILDKDNPLATKVQTRDGRKARIICVDFDNGETPIIAILEDDVVNGTSGEFLGFFALDGRGIFRDLINAPVTHKQWVNVFKRKSDGGLATHTHSTRAAADNDPCNDNWTRIACIEIEFKEGEGL